MKNLKNQLYHLKKKLTKSEERYKYLRSIKKTPGMRNEDEYFPKHFENIRIVLIFDTNVLFDQGVDILDRLVKSNNYAILFPRVAINEIDGLKKNFFR